VGNLLSRRPGKRFAQGKRGGEGSQLLKQQSELQKGERETPPKEGKKFISIISKREEKYKI